MITEDYVSFPVAKLLKEKEFDIRCGSWIERTDKGMKKYGKNANKMFRGWGIQLGQDNEDATFYPCPTQALACKWLRVKYNIDIYSSPDEGIYKVGNKSYGYTIDEKNYKSGFLTPEEAIEAALRYALENLV